MKYALGRVHIPDSRDKNYPISKALPPKGSAPEREYRYWWDSAWWGDQGYLPHCVAFSWVHWLEDGPITHFYKNRDFDPSYLNESRHEKHQPLFNPASIYNEAQKIDEWVGEDYDGTSVRAGAKILRQLGVVSEFRWASTLDEVVQTVLHLGPMVVGTWWYSDMFYPDKNGLIKATGHKAGGHAYVITGVNVKKQRFRIKNSWGRCFDDQTEILTESGWKLFRNLCVSDKVATLNSQTEQLEFQIPSEHHCYPYVGEM